MGYVSIVPRRYVRTALGIAVPSMPAPKLPSAPKVPPAVASVLPGAPGMPPLPASLSVPGLPSLAWAPPKLPAFNPADYDPKKFTEDQYNRWVAPAMKTAIDKGRTQLAQALGIPLPSLPTLPKSDLSNWATGYVAAHGIPKNLEDGTRMVTALARAQAEKLGVPPEYIAAADAILHPPKSVEEGAAMVVNLGKGYLEKFGVPLLQNELMSVSSNLAMITQAIPVQFAVAGFDALKDGKLSGQEIAGIAVQAASYACGLLLQGIGIPAPLGAILAAVVTQALQGVADNVIHSQDADTRAREAAYAALDAQRQALMKDCTKQATQTWNATQDYWDKVIAPIQALLNNPIVADRLVKAGGIRYYGRNNVVLPPGVQLPWTPADVAAKFREGDDYMAQAVQQDAIAATADATAKKMPTVAGRGASYQQTKGYWVMQAATARKSAAALRAKAVAAASKPLYSYGFDCLWWEGSLDTNYDMQHADFRTLFPANARPYPDGCKYFASVGPTWDNAKDPGVPGGLRAQSLDPTKWQQTAYWPDPTSLWERCATRKGTAIFHAQDTEAICKLADAAAGNVRYAYNSGVTPQKMQVRITPYTDHKSPVVTQSVDVLPGAMVNGKPNAQAAFMFWGAIRPAAVWSAYATGGQSDTDAWKSFAYIDPSHIEIYKIAGNWTNKLDVPFNYCNVNDWATAVQVAAAAAALVQQDIIRTVAWQIGAETAAQHLADLKAAQAAAAAASSAAAAKVAAQQASANLTAKRVMTATASAKALAQARRISGTFTAALKSRLAFQAALAAKAAAHKALVTAGVLAGAAAGAFLLWKVMSKPHRA